MNNIDKKYKVYLDVSVTKDMVWNDETSANWFEISCHLSDFTDKMESDEYFRRIEWGEVQLRNEPYNGTSVFDTINELSLSQEIRIKVEYKDKVFRGYFGKNDCESDEDNKILSVTPETLDQYTAILENNDEEINVFEDIGVYGAEWTGVVDSYSDSHIIQLDKDDDSSLPAARTQESDGDLKTGVFISKAQKDYEITYEYSLSADFYAGFYVALIIYNADGSTYENKVIATKVVTTEQNKKRYIEETFKGTVNIQKGQSARLYMSLFTGHAYGISFRGIDYKASTFKLTRCYSGLEETEEVTVNLTSSNVVTVPIWDFDHLTYNKLRVSDGGRDIAQFFDDTTNEPLTDVFDYYGINYGYDYDFTRYNIVASPLKGLRLGALVEAFEDKKYQLSEVTIYRGTETKSHSHRYSRTYCTCKFSRQEIFLGKDENGEWIDPGDSWQTDYYPGNGGTILWYRIPYNDSVDDWNLTAEPEKSSYYHMERDGNTEYIESITSRRAYPVSDETSVTYRTAKKFKDIVKKLYTGSSDKLYDKEVKSTFFWNDDEAAMSYFDSSNSGYNYVTGAKNTLNNILCLHTTDLITDTSKADSDDSSLKMNFGDFMENLKKLFYGHLYWWVAEDGTLWIEHLKRMEYVTSIIDRSNDKLLDEISKFTYDKDDLYETVTIEMQNASYNDFTDNEIKNEHIASKERSDNDMDDDVSIENITTDIKYCVEGADDLDNGLILLACDDDGVCINANVPVAAKEWENGKLALSNILLNYCTYAGIAKKGKINGADISYTNLRRTKRGDAIAVQGVLSESAGKGSSHMKTPIGTGLIDTMSFNLDKQITTDIELLYGSEIEESNLGWVLVISKSTEPNGEIWYDFSNRKKTDADWVWNMSDVTEHDDDANKTYTRTFTLSTSDGSTRDFNYYMRVRARLGFSDGVLSFVLYVNGEQCNYVRVTLQDGVAETENSEKTNFISVEDSVEIKLIMQRIGLQGYDIEGSFNKITGADSKYDNIKEVKITKTI
jgi:hypothetical protein